MNIEDKIKEWNSILVKTGDYKDLKLPDVNHCLDLAEHVIDFYLLNGKILEFRKNTKKSEDNFLSPKQLSHLDDSSWIVHYVASDSGNIYCPVLGEVSKIEDYSLKIFNEDVAAKKYTPSWEGLI